MLLKKNKIEASFYSGQISNKDIFRAPLHDIINASHELTWSTKPTQNETTVGFTMSFVTTVVLILFGLYIANSIYVIYHLFHLPNCEGNAKKCLRPHAIIDKKLEVSSAVLGSFVLETMLQLKKVSL